MDLDYYEKAHLALISNFDMDWKRSCLKHFISELCNKNKTATLVSFDYGDMLQDVLNILYKRAQASDLRYHDYYRLLYAIHIKNKDYRKAAYYMYECALRLRLEISGINSLKRQEKCYLLCLNLLKMVDKKYAWIAVPYKFEEMLPEKLSYSEIYKKNEQYQKAVSELEDKNANCFIVNVDDINKNYLTVNLMIKLSTIVQNQSSLSKYFFYFNFKNLIFQNFGWKKSLF